MWYNSLETIIFGGMKQMLKKKIILYSSAFIISLGTGAVFSRISDNSCDFEKVISEEPQNISVQNIQEASESENETVLSSEAVQAPNEKLININTASAKELMVLEGIGEKLSLRIIEFRESNGSFEKIEDIMKVSGIGEKKFSKIKEHICVQ